ncbi:epidermal patterning factor-like protein [Musa troglodytarum]|uniref:Epidermal patterning factor-like protein n=1 Tax=Musa troglodytarum TaxID=320322 RepID=A0A9E7G8V8_9LILI|nr:epidermal patterning factor-like protein [Musa troglodytarum]
MHVDIVTGVGSSVTEPYPQAAAAAEEEEARRRQLVGGEPGSDPPRCTGMCGECTPCQPVHVALPPGTPVTTEYYPEAWRCKCGDRLYMP